MNVTTGLYTTLLENRSLKVINMKINSVVELNHPLNYIDAKYTVTNIIYSFMNTYMITKQTYPLSLFLGTYDFFVAICTNMLHKIPSHDHHIHQPPCTNLHTKIIPCTHLHKIPFNSHYSPLYTRTNIHTLLFTCRTFT